MNARQRARALYALIPIVEHEHGVTSQRVTDVPSAYVIEGKRAISARRCLEAQGWICKAAPVDGKPDRFIVYTERATIQIPETAADPARHTERLTTAHSAR